MIRKSFFIRLCFSAVILVTANGVMAQTVSTEWTNKKATKWFKSMEWRERLGLQPHSSTNKLEFARQYEKNKTAWDAAFQFIKEHKLDELAVGKYPIEEEQVYATVTEAPGKEPANTGWESHRKYVDLQYIIKGKEKIGVIDTSRATITKVYDASKDVQNYNADGKFYIAEPGVFFLFFPSDAHRPGIAVEGREMIKKLVIKINYVQLQSSVNYRKRRSSSAGE